MFTAFQFCNFPSHKILAALVARVEMSEINNAEVYVHTCITSIPSGSPNSSLSLSCTFLIEKGDAISVNESELCIFIVMIILVSPLE